MAEIQQVTLLSINFFKIPISDWKVKKEQILSLIDLYNEDKRIDCCYSDYFMYNNRPEYMPKIIGMIADELQEFINQSGISVYPVNQWQMWSQRYINGDFHGVHNHGFGHLSAILYVEFDKDKHQSTRFYTPIPNAFTGIIDNLQPDVEEGDLILFPSTILHECPPSNCPESRTIVAFNIPIGEDVQT